MKKYLVFLFVLTNLISLSAQQQKDLILVVDTSSSMFAYYNEVGSYLSGPFLSENLSSGDTLHIVSFGQKPRVEIARRILGKGDMETAAARIWLLYPLAPASDSAAALNYVERYVRSIPEGRAKKIFVVSGNDISGQLNAAAPRLQPDADLYFIRASSRMAANGIQPIGTSSEAAGNRPGSTASLAANSPAGNQIASETSAAGNSAPGNTDIEGIEGVIDDSASGNSGGLSGDGSVSQNSDNVSPGKTNSVDQNQAITAKSSDITIGNVSIPLPLLIALGLLLLLIIFIIILLRMRHLHGSPKKVLSLNSEDSVAAKDAELLNSFASRQAKTALKDPHRSYTYKDRPNLFLTKPPIVNLFVEDQSVGIGRRNVHSLKKGVTYTVGGGNSDFLIFLVSFPAKLGLLSFDGTHCTFTPLKKEFFPDIGSAPVDNCIGKTIRIVSKMNYEVFFHFEPYKDPLIAMNKLLNSINVPEPPKV